MNFVYSFAYPLVSGYVWLKYALAEDGAVGFLQIDFRKHRANTPHPHTSSLVAVSCLEREFMEYADGKRKRFSPKLIRKCVQTHTSFQKRVCKVMHNIPYASVMSYGEIARSVSSPDAARAVGGVCGANPFPLLFPCHRVVRQHYNSALDVHKNRSYLGGYRYGLKLKELLLVHEGL